MFSIKGGTGPLGRTGFGTPNANPTLRFMRGVLVPIRGGLRMAKGYCVKCRKTVEIKDAKAVTLKNGKPAMRGTCPFCGTTIVRIGAAA